MDETPEGQLEELLDKCDKFLERYSANYPDAHLVYIGWRIVHVCPDKESAIEQVEWMQLFGEDAEIRKLTSDQEGTQQ